ncbi:hypothetical protein B566_EDAN005020 [Ephemera danica]|nr:hypothetical protein B566_EDAN005020 [Ephemera danica]
MAARNLGPEQDLATHYKNYVPIMLGLSLNSDVEFVPGVDFLVRKFAQLHRSPVYYYQFSYDGGRSTCHGDELGYILGVEWKSVDATSEEVKTRYLDIGTQLVMTNENLNENRNNFWRKFIRQHRRPSD